MNKPILKRGLASLALLAVVGAIPVSAAIGATRFTDYPDVIYYLDNETFNASVYRIQIADSTKTVDQYPTEITIKEPFTTTKAGFEGTYTVTSILPGAFKLTNEEKGDYGIQTLGYNREHLLMNMQAINIASTVTNIGNLAFSGCGIPSITIPASVTDMGTSVFANCPNLETATINAALTAGCVPNSMFENCTALKSVVITDPNINSIGDCSFKGCSALTDITFASSNLSVVFDSAFDGIDMSQVTVHVPLNCEANFAKLAELGATVTEPEIPSEFTINSIKYAVTSTDPMQVYVVGTTTKQIMNPVVIPATVDYGDFTFSVVGIQHHAFDHCQHMPSITLPEGIQVIGASAFTYCEALTSIEIPSTVTTSGCDHVYGNFIATLFDNSGITSITIPESVTTIGAGALYTMPNLTEATINANITSLPNLMFSGSNNLTTLHLNSPITSIGENAFQNINMENLTITVPDGATLADYQIFADLGVASITTESGTEIYPEPAFNPENAPALPTANGWYKIKFAEKGSAYTNDELSTAVLGKYVVNLEEEYQHSSGDYSFGFYDVDEGKEAVAFVWLELSDAQYKAKSVNGHYTNAQAIAQRGTGASFALTVTNEAEKYVAFGAGWTPYGDTNNNFWGLSTKNDASQRNRYRITPVDVSGYDIYTVTIANASNGNRVKNDARVTCLNEANRGIASVFNGGYFFFPAGTTLTAADFSGSENNGITPRITVDVDAKTIHAEYSLEGLYNRYKTFLTASLTATGLFTESETFTYPDYDASLTLDQNKAAAYSSAYEYTRPKLHGKKVYLRVATASGNAVHDYLTTAENGTVPEHQEDWTLLGAWTVEYKDGNKITLYNEVMKKYISNSAPTTVGDRNDFIMSDTPLELTMHFNDAEATSHHGHFSFNTNGTDQNVYAYMHAKSRPTIGKWGNAGDGSWWKFYIINGELEQSWIDELETTLNPEATPLGINPGEWQVTDHPEVLNLYAELQEIAAEEPLDYARLYEVTRSVPAEMTWTKNEVQSGRYYRIRTSAANMAANNITTPVYLSNQGGDGNRGSRGFREEDETDAKNLIFHAVESSDAGKFYMICYGDGNYIYATTTNNSPFLRMNTLSELTDISSAPANAIKFRFNNRDASEKCSYGIFITSGYFSGNRSIHSHKQLDTDTHLSANMCGNDTDAFHWFNIEQVNELPIEMTAQGYGSLIAPVAVKFMNLDEHTVYVQKKAENIEFQTVGVDEVIPAGTPILIKGTTAVNATIVYDVAAETETPAEVRRRAGDASEEIIISDIVSLHGSHIASAHAAADGMVTLALTADAVNGVGANEVHFTKVNPGEAINPNTLHLTVPENINTMVNEELLRNDATTAVVNLESGVTTGISEVQLETGVDGVSVIYDLQGRRLSAPVKGINIINGKKILIK